MGFISKIGPLEISVISTFTALFLYRIQASPESRIATGLVFLCSSRFGASFINGFSISEATALSFGQLDTVFAYLMLAFAFLEILLLKHFTKWGIVDIWIIASLFGFGFLNLVWKFAYATGFSANDFLYLVVIFLFLTLHPTREDLRFLPYFGAVIILLVSVVALVKYQNPLFPYRQVDYGLGSPYQNRVWDFFGHEERFRGPYFHPNQLGIQITFLSTLALLKSPRFYLGILPFSFILLFLASSRTSIFALTFGLLVKIYFDATKSRDIDSADKKNFASQGNLHRKSKLVNVALAIIILTILGFIARQIVGQNTTGTGRLQNYEQTISAIQDNFFVGRGPSLFSINTTENTILTILSFYGLLGLILLVVLAIALGVKFRNAVRNESGLTQVVLAVFLVASSGEALLTGSSVDTGLYYLLVMLTLTRNGTT
jgi:O-antigen ligase